jgi:hypothetical protein
MMPEKLKGLPVLQSTLNIGFHSLKRSSFISNSLRRAEILGDEMETSFWKTIEAWTRNLGSFLHILRGSTVRDDITRRGDTSTGAAA